MNSDQSDETDELEQQRRKTQEDLEVEELANAPAAVIYPLNETVITTQSIVQVSVNKLRIEPDLNAQLLRKDSITRLRADMDRQSQQLDKILAAHNQTGEDHFATMDRQFYRTTKKDDITVAPSMDFRSIDKPREGATSAMLVTEPSPEQESRPGGNG